MNRPQVQVLLPRRKKGHRRHSSMFPPQEEAAAASLVVRSVSFPETLAPLMEGPDYGGAADADEDRRKEGWTQWVRIQLSRVPSMTSSSAAAAADASSSSFRCSDLRLLLGVMGAPLAPIYVTTNDGSPHLSIKDTPVEVSTAKYILQQYMAASGGLKLQRSIRNSYARGKARMVVSELETGTKLIRNRSSSSRTVESGGFVLWQMAPDKWFVELAIGGSKLDAGSNGEVVWRHTPWLGAHAARGPVRPLRRTLQGLDPLTTARMFGDARCIGEKKVDGEDCFVLKLCADPQILRARSEGPVEIIRHVLFGYFSQRTGFLLLLEDSHLTRIQANAGGDAVYWETTISSSLHDYSLVEGIMVAHSGRSNATLYKFGETAASHTKTRMEEDWTIEEVAYNVPGLSVECFIPPSDIRRDSITESCDLPRAKVSTLEAKSKGCLRESSFGDQSLAPSGP
ncbi:uncharacterized protein LOC122041041 [Zingiber officinale]|uniref:Uncharacterized protein n=1 Tax=Zingiber officinale TaxID=94328 RepID=A0A8J5LJM7_ZINOF|nr:uncharacterized protein LOC122041041 [Zingiber officinale]KAG6527671.1 hypothetical protein ZIOFF_009797 [Zingiber officinale]